MPLSFKSGMDSGDDWDLVRRIREGDDQAFEILMARYKRPILQFIFRMTGQAAESEDIAQEVFVRAYQGIRKPSFARAGARFSTWLFQVARHAALDFLRRQKRHPEESLAILADAEESVAGPGKTAHEEAVSHEIGRQIADAVSRLPDDQRAALILSEYEGLPDAEIATIMECSTKSVEALLYRGRRFLRARLAHLLA